MKSKAKVETITLTLTLEEAYAMCNKLHDEALVTHGGFCEFDQIEKLQKIGKDLGELCDHASKDNDLEMDVKKEVYERAEKKKKKLRQYLPTIEYVYCKEDEKSNPEHIYFRKIDNCRLYLEGKEVFPGNSIYSAEQKLVFEDGVGKLVGHAKTLSGIHEFLQSQVGKKMILPMFTPGNYSVSRGELI